MAFHQGLDFMAEDETPVYVAVGGIVTTAEQAPDYGKITQIDQGSGLEIRYAHTSFIAVEVGERMEKDQLIARVGNTGRSIYTHIPPEWLVAGPT